MQYKNILLLTVASAMIIVAQENQDAVNSDAATYRKSCCCPMPGPQGPRGFPGVDFTSQNYLYATRVTNQTITNSDSIEFDPAITTDNTWQQVSTSQFECPATGIYLGSYKVVITATPNSTDISIRARLNTVGITSSLIREIIALNDLDTITTTFLFSATAGQLLDIFCTTDLTTVTGSNASLTIIRIK